MPENSLESLVSLYKEFKERLFKVEGVTQISAISAKYNENIRHTLDHVLLGLDPENSDDEKKDHFSQAYGHLENLAPDACQSIAGLCLTETDELIKNAKFFERNEEAYAAYNYAVELYTRGRGTRSSDWREACKIFLQAAEKAREARTLIVPQDSQTSVLLRPLKNTL